MGHKNILFCQKANMLRLHPKTISSMVSFLVVVFTFINITLVNSDATLVDLLNDVKNKLAGIEEDVHDVNKTVVKILHHVAGTAAVELIPNTGTAGSSSEWSAEYSAKYAFISSPSSNEEWRNERDQFPAAVWMQFPRSHVLAKIGFSSKWDVDTPPRVEVIGSHDCSTWTILLNVENIVRDEHGYDVFREWSIPPKNRVSFSCFGLRWPAKRSGESGDLFIRKITMWELK